LRSEGEASPGTIGIAEAVGRNLALFEDAARGRDRLFHFEILGRVVRLRLAGDALEGVLVDALRHHEVPAEDAQARPELEICAWESRSTGIGPDLHGIPILGDQPAGGDLMHDPRTLVHGSSGFLAVQGQVPWAAQGYDAARRRAFLWARDSTVLGPWGERTKPFLEILHAWLLDSPWQPIHGGAVGADDGGFLVAGGSGVGKSTTVLACVRAGWTYAGDDYLAIRTNAGEGYVDNLYGSARLCVDMADRFTEFRQAEIGAVSMGGVEKRDMILSEVLPPSRFGGFPLRAILLPRITGGPRSRLRPASPGQATVAIGAVTLHFLRAGAREAFEKIAGIAAATPAYRLDLGDDIDELPAVIGSEIGVGPA
jgi:hypothetical protein